MKFLALFFLAVSAVPVLSEECFEDIKVECKNFYSYRGPFQYGYMSYSNEEDCSISVIECSEDKLTWTCPYRYSDKNPNESENWHAFLNSLFCKFSEYNVQIAKRSYSVNHTVDFKNEDCEIRELIDEVQRTMIHENNFERFLNKTMQCDAAEYDSIKDLVLTEVQIEELNRVLSLTLRDRIYVNCVGTNMYIKGNYITTGDIIDILNKNRKVTDAKCKDLLLSGKTKFVNIFALNTFFIDVTLNSSFTNSQKIVLMSVIAPKWENIGKNRIELKSEDAELPSISNGIDNEPRNPGDSGGNFFGIGSEFVNGINLEISVSEGDGSRGQNRRKGENGVDEVDGETPTTTPSDIECNGKYCEGRNKIDDFNCKKGECFNIYDLQYFECMYEMFGKTGTKGEKGRYPRNIALIELKSHSKISLFRNSGENESDGKGGNRRKGNDIIVKCDGKWMEDTKSTVLINNLHKAKIINEYKSYVRENLHERYTKLMLNDFFNQLETNTKVKKFYSTLGLIDDLKHLEDQYYKLNTHLNLIPFYQSFLKRISEYAYSPKEVGDPRIYKKILCYVYAAALGTMQNIQDKPKLNIIIDIPKYLRDLENEIKELTDLKFPSYKVILINKYVDEYKHEIDFKINEAKELISQEITPKIQNIGTEIDTKMEALVNEVIHLQKEAPKELKELINKKQKLENILGLQGIFSVFKIFGDVVNFLGPAGEVACSVIETGSTIAEPFVSDNTDDYNKVLGLPESVSELRSINNKIKIFINQRIIRLRNSLESISLEISKYPDILNSMTFKISGIKVRLDKLDENEPNFKELQALENELDIALESQEKISDSKNATQLAVISNLKIIVMLSSLLSDSYNKYKNNPEKFDVISSALEQNEAKFKKLKLYEQKIYNTIIPMLQNLESDFQDMMSKLGTNSKVALDLTKWHVDDTLQNMMLLVRQLTREFEVEDNIARCLENLEEAANALIRVFQYIQDYQEDQSLASYIAEISSVTATDIIVANNAVLQEALRDSVRNLEITVRSNIVLQRYKIAINALKQFVFPFAQLYLRGLIPPPKLALSDNENKTTLDDLVSKATAEFGNINLRLEDYKDFGYIRGECIGLGEFQSGYESIKPFFVWRNEQHSKIISDLLSGNAVMIKADVRNSAPDIDAIKFYAINFNFKTRNKTLQTEINNKLKGFRMTITHLGNSEYRFADKIYQMMTSSRNISCYFEEEAKGQSHCNVTLSPYASWKVKLDSLTNRISFKDLEMYKDSVDLTLEGYGFFIDNEYSYCTNIVVDKYYKAIGTY